MNHIQKSKFGSKFQNNGIFQHASKVSLNLGNCSYVNETTISILRGVLSGTLRIAWGTKHSKNKNEEQNEWK